MCDNPLPLLNHRIIFTLCPADWPITQLYQEQLIHHRQFTVFYRITELCAYRSKSKRSDVRYYKPIAKSSAKNHTEIGSGNQSFVDYF